MKPFSALLERLYYEPGRLGKERLLKDYFAATPDPDRGYALAIVAGTLSIPAFRRSMVIGLIAARTDPVLFAMSYDYVGELSETVAHLWPRIPGHGELPRLSELVESLQAAGKDELPDRLAGLLDRMTSPERWALLKIGGGTLRIGVSARLVKQVLADYGGKPIDAVETVWHGLAPPYLSLFAWLEGRADMPAATGRPAFTPVMLAQPLEEADHARIAPETFAAEWKYDGVRIQISNGAAGRALFTRTGEDIAPSFPDVLDALNFPATLDGELVVRNADGIGTFNDLQQRLNRKAPGEALMRTLPAAIVAYDALRLGDRDLRGETFDTRRALLAEAIAAHRPGKIELSPLVSFGDFAELVRLRDDAAARRAVEGLMLKRRDSAYVAGRPAGQWYKWKVAPKLVDAVLMYAQRGSGKRSSYYSDFTFGLWKDDKLLPIGKAYFGFTDAELLQLDRWVRHHGIQNFGPVREVEKALVFEVAFDAVQRSKRHKSGFALRFPRIHRIRWDKPAAEADRLDALDRLVEARPPS